MDRIYGQSFNACLDEMRTGQGIQGQVTLIFIHHYFERMGDALQNIGEAIISADLLRIPGGTITEAGLRHNIDVGIQYLEAWLGGSGCVPIYNLMEDAATSEISRAQIWQWIRHDTGVLDDGRQVTADLVRSMVPEELDKTRSLTGDQRYDAGHFPLARRLFEKLVTGDDFAEFLTLDAYRQLD